jgi:hypothetical protein
MTAALAVVDEDPEADVGPTGRHAPSALLWSVGVVAMFAVGLFVAHVWYQGGTRLVMDGARLGVHPVSVGSSVSFGVDLTTHGGPSVVAERATARHTSNVEVQYAIIRFEPGHAGIGTADGPVPGSTPLGTRGISVAQPASVELHESCTTAGPATPPVCTPPPPPDRGHTQLVVTITPRGPGPWSVSDITVTYQSWRRTRTARSTYVVTGQAT